MAELEGGVDHEDQSTEYDLEEGHPGCEADSQCHRHSGSTEPLPVVKQDRPRPLTRRYSRLELDHREVYRRWKVARSDFANGLPSRRDGGSKVLER